MPRVGRESVVTRLLLTVVCLLMLSVPAIVLAQTPAPTGPARDGRPQAARGEFVPVSELPPVDQMPAGPLVLGAYGFIWAVVLVYVFSVARRLSAVQKDLEALQHRTRR
jgi:CcmD family protein